MGASTLARGPAELINAQVTFGRFRNRLMRSAIQHELPVGVSNLHHSDRIVGAIARTCAASNTCDVVDRDFTASRLATDCACWALNHANGIDAMHTCVRNHVPIVNRAMSKKSWVVIVGIGACSNAIIASSASVEIDKHGRGTVHKPFLNEKLEHGFVQLISFERDLSNSFFRLRRLRFVDFGVWVFEYVFLDDGRWDQNR